MKAKIRSRSLLFFLLIFMGGISTGFGQETPVREILLDASMVLTALSPDGSMILVGGQGIRILNAKTGEVMKEFDTSMQTIAVAFSPDNSMASACDRNGKVTIWDISTETILHQFDFNFHDENYMFGQDSIALQISTNGKYLLVGPSSTDAVDTIQVWDLESRNSIYNFSGYLLSNCALFSDAKLFFKATFRGYVVDLITLEQQFNEFNYGYAPSPDGDEILCFSIIFNTPQNEYIYKIVNAKSGRLLREHHVEGTGGDLRAIFSPSGKYILINVDDAATIYDYATWTPLRSFPPGEVIPQAFSTDDHWLLTQEENSLKIWDISNLQSGVSDAAELYR